MTTWIYQFLIGRHRADHLASKPAQLAAFAKRSRERGNAFHFYSEMR